MKINMYLSKNNKYLLNINLFVDFQKPQTYNIRQRTCFKTTWKYIMQT